MNTFSKEGKRLHSLVNTMFIFFLWFETHQYVNNAIARENEIKAWSREKKMKLIAEMNPSLKFLNEEIFGKWPPDELPERK